MHRAKINRYEKVTVEFRASDLWSSFRSDSAT